MFDFKKPTQEDLMKYLRSILNLERKSLKESTIEEIAFACQSVREAVGRLQQEVALLECEGEN